jgi:hypothetical protein
MAFREAAFLDAHLQCRYPSHIAQAKDEGTDVITLFPSSFSLFADQMKTRGCHRVSLEQSR